MPVNTYFHQNKEHDNIYVPGFSLSYRKPTTQTACTPQGEKREAVCIYYRPQLFFVAVCRIIVHLETAQMNNNGKKLPPASLLTHVPLQKVQKNDKNSFRAASHPGCSVAENTSHRAINGWYNIVGHRLRSKLMASTAKPYLQYHVA